MTLEIAIRDLGEVMSANLGDAFVALARENAPRGSGALADSIQASAPERVGRKWKVRVTVGAPWGKYQEEGTGVYGPTGRRITPRKPGGVLVFDWPAAGGVVFFASVAGSRPTHWWSRTLEQWPDIVRNL